MPVTSDPVPGALSLTITTPPGTILSVSNLTGSRFGEAIFGTAIFGGLLSLNTLSLTVATAPGGLTLTED